MSGLIQVKANQLSFNEKAYRCAVGHSGFAPKHYEGDGTTPLGIFPLRECWYRADLMDAPKTQLPLKIIQPNDGWCDDPKSPNYNRHVKLVDFKDDFRGVDKDGCGAEKLWRPDGTYDLMVPIGYNDDPVVPGEGSAIFFHVAKPGYPPTEGCVAVAKADLLQILHGLTPELLLEIRAK